MFQISNLSKSYNGKTVLGPVDLNISQGKTCVLLGPSGCGKSTLLRILIRLIEPDDGTLLFDDKPFPTTDVEIREQRRRMGYVIQSGGLFPHFTILENITLPARLSSWSVERTEKRVEELRKLTSLPADTFGRYPMQLSGGQQQRVNLMRALMLDPQVLLLDEPLGALDPMIRASLQNDLLKIFRSLKKTVVMVTHDLTEAAFFSDEIVLMNAGRIVQKGKMAELLEHPADPFVKEFVQAQRYYWEGATA